MKCLFHGEDCWLNRADARIGSAMEGPLEYQKPDYGSMFHEFDYGKHLVLMGATESGKTNWLMWFITSSPLRMIVFNPIRHIEYRKICDIDVNEDVVLSEEFESLLNDYSLNKICVTPSEDVLGDPTVMKNLWNTLCKKIYLHRDPRHKELMRSLGKKEDEDYTRQVNLALLCDELMMVMDSEQMQQYHFNILMSGQNYRITHIGNTQRHQYISKLLTTQSRRKIILEMDQYEIYALKNKVYGVEYAGLLQPFHFIYADRNKLHFHHPVPLIKGKG